MPKDTKKKANPILDDEEKDETETEETSDEETTDEDTDTDTDEADEADEEEVEEKPKAKAKGKPATKVSKPLIERDAPKVKGRNDIQEEMKKDADNVKAILAKQPKVRMFIPLGIGEKKGSKGAYESVTINGYRMVFPKGEYITVPESVSLILEEHYNMTPENTEAGEAFRLDRPRHKDGMSTDEALN